MKKKNLARGLTGIFGGILVFSLDAAQILPVYKDYIDSNLGIVSKKIVNDPDAKPTWDYEVDSKEDARGFDLTTTKGMHDYAQAVSEDLAGQGQSLLKNDNDALPLAKGSKVSVFGGHSYLPNYGGAMGSVSVASECVNIPDQLKAEGFELDSSVSDAYRTTFAGMTHEAAGAWGGTTTVKYVNDDGTYPQSSASALESLPRGFTAITNPNPYSNIELSSAELGLTAKGTKSGTAIVTLGRMGSEAGYYLPGEAGKGKSYNGNTWDKNHDVLGLSANELDILKYARANYEKVIVLINADSAMDVPELFEKGGEYEADAVLWTGLPGQYGFKATAQILDGTINPSGGLMDTFATKASVSPSGINTGYFAFKGFDPKDKDATSNTKSGWYMAEEEGIFTGYKYYESRYFDSILGIHNASKPTTDHRDVAKSDASEWKYQDETVRSFGDGLSYTTFSEQLEKVEVSGENYVATVRVTNTGSVSGKDNVQLYVSVPQTDTSDYQTSAIQLVGYGKTGELKAGESTTVEITVTMRDFAVWDEKYEHDGVKGAYILPKGTYRFAVGDGAHAALNNVLTDMGKTGLVDADGNTVTGDKNAVKSVRLDALQPITRSEKGVLLQNQLQDMGVENFTGDNDTDIVELDPIKGWDTTFPVAARGLAATEAMQKGLTCQVYTVTDHATNKLGKDVIWNKPSDYTFASAKPQKGEKIAYDDERLVALVQKMSMGEALNSILNAGGSTFPAIESVGQPEAHQDDGPMGFDGPAGALYQNWSGQTQYGKDLTKDSEDYYATMENRPLPTEPVIGATFNHELVEEAGRVIGNISLWNGCMAIWGPGANLHRNPYNSRNHEYYSEDPVTLGYMVNDYSKGLQEKGLIAAPKHFCFNDYDLNRSGIAPFMSEQRAREGELRGFEKVFINENALASMGAFGRAGATFCNAHEGLMLGILRGEWDWKGYMVTDMVNPAYYMNARDSIIMGTSGMLSGNGGKNVENNINGWTEMTETGLANDKWMQQRVQDAVHEFYYAAVNSNFMNGLTASSHTEYIETWYEALTKGLLIGSSIGTGLAAVAYIALSILEKQHA